MASLGDIIATGGVVQRTWDEMNRQKADDEYQAAARKVNLEAARANAAMLPGRNAAESAELALRRSQAEADAGLVGKRRANQGQALDLQSERLTHERKTLPTRLQGASDTLTAEANKARIALEKSKLDLTRLPSMLEQARVGGLIDDVKLGEMALGGLGYALLTGDDDTVVAYANEVLKGTTLPQLRGEQVTGFEPDVMQGEDGEPIQVLRFATQSGKQIPVRDDAIWRAYKQLNPGELVKLGRGGALARVSPGGEGEIILRNEAGGAGAAQKDTALQKNVDYLVNQGIAKDAKAAFALLRTTTAKPREDAILSLAMVLISRGVGYRGEKGQAKAIEDAKRMVDAVKGRPAGQSAPGVQDEGLDEELPDEVEDILNDLGVR